MRGALSASSDRVVPYESRYLVRCASKDKGKLVMQACEAGCIGCKKCQRECPSGAVTVRNNIAHIDIQMY